MWAHEHIDHSITEYGIQTLNEFLNHIRAITQKNNNGALMTMFYRNFVLLVLEKLLSVMTDTLHKASFPEMCATLKTICYDLSSNQYLGQIYEPSQNQQWANNVEYVAARLSSFLQSKFDHLTEDVTRSFLIGCFKLADDSPVRSPSKQQNASNSKQLLQDPYVQHCEDFLVSIRSVHRSAASSKNSSQPPPQQNGSSSPQRRGNAMNGGAPPVAVQVNDDDL